MLNHLIERHGAKHPSEIDSDTALARDFFLRRLRLDSAPRACGKIASVSAT